MIDHETTHDLQFVETEKDTVTDITSRFLNGSER